VDNASIDGSREYLRKEKRIRLIENKENLGFAKASNQGIKIAQGKYIFLLNSDTVVKKGSLVKLIEFAKKEKDGGGMAPRLLNADGSIQASCSHSPSVKGVINEFWLGKKGAFLKYFPKASKPVAVDMAVGAALFLPQETIKKIGLLDERYFMYFEDFDYCRRLKKAGLKLYYLPGVTITHFHGASSRKAKTEPNQWLRESSKIYHGCLKYHLITFIIWSSQKFKQVRNKIA